MNWHLERLKRMGRELFRATEGASQPSRPKSTRGALGTGQLELVDDPVPKTREQLMFDTAAGCASIGFALGRRGAR